MNEVEHEAEPADPKDRPFRVRKHKHLPLWQEIGLLLVIALLLAIVLKSFFVQAFYIPSESMEPQFVRNDRILVQKWSYWDGTPQRGDIVVFKDPGGWLGLDEGTHNPSPLTSVLERIGLYPAGGHLVKRVIGVGGDRIACCDAEGRASVNGTPLDEDAYLPEGSTAGDASSPFDVRVPAGHLWLMGDNRNNSYDSRGHMGDPGGGFVADDLVVGKVFVLVWPWKHFEFLSRPANFEDIPQP